MKWILDDIVYTNIKLPDDGIRYKQISSYNYLDINNIFDNNLYADSYTYLNSNGILFDENKNYDSYSFFNNHSIEILDSYSYSSSEIKYYDNYLPDFLINGCSYDDFTYRDNEFFTKEDYLDNSFQSSEEIFHINSYDMYKYDSYNATQSNNCLINGLDIDWNNAQVSGINYDTKTITTTSDLIKAIQDLVYKTKISFK